jgi:hypothetical protein
MNAPRRGRYLPSVSLVLALALAGIYLGVFLPLRERARGADAPLKRVWDDFVAAHAASEACAGVRRDQLEARARALEATARDLQQAAALVEGRLTWPTQIQALLRQPFQYGEFQNECQRAAEALHTRARERKVAFEGVLTNRLADALGLAAYSADLPDPTLLWPRLLASQHVVLAAIESQVATIRVVQQLPAVSYESVNGGRKLVEELPLRLEVAGSLPQVARLVAALPLHGSEVALTGLGGELTNKPVLFLGQTLLRKSAPAKEGEAPRAGEVLLDLQISALVLAAPGTAANEFN